MHHVPAYPTEILDPTRPTGVVLVGMGGPDGPDAVGPFLGNLFGDPEIFPVPGPFGRILGRLIAAARTPAVRRRYALVAPDGATPQLATSREQARELARRLGAAGFPAIPGIAMRYWHPFPEEELTRLVDAGAVQFLVVPTYPQYSRATSGSSLDAVLAAGASVAPAAPVHVVSHWHDDRGFVRALARPVLESLEGWARRRLDPERCAVVWAAHSLPRRIVKAGDPYLEQVEVTVDRAQALVAGAMAAGKRGEWFGALSGGVGPLLAFQSRVGPIRWVGPEITGVVRELAAGGCRHLHVQPVTFTCEHIETLVELDLELAGLARNAGIGEFRRGPALGTDPDWLDGFVEMLIRRAFPGREVPRG